MWVLPNRFFFTKWFYDKFHPSKYVQEETGPQSFDPAQRLLKDYIAYDSPYRGVLAYFGLGVGKSAASILASESFIRRHKKVIVLLPSSLENNYRKELSKFSQTGKLMHKRWYLLKSTVYADLDNYDKILQTFMLSRDQVKKLGNLWVPYLPKDFPESLVQDTATPKSMSKADKEITQAVYEHILNTRYTFIHYNGINNKHLDKFEAENLFDDALVIIDEVHTFISRVTSGGKIARRLYNMLISKTNLRFVLLSGTPVINHPFELCYTLNLLRGPMVEYTFNTLKDKYFPPLDQLIPALGDMYQYIDLLELDPTNTKLTLTLMPSGWVRKNNTSELIKGRSVTIEHIVKELKRNLKMLSIRYKTTEHTALPDKKEAFMEYFLDQSDPLNPKVKEPAMQVFLRRIQGIVSYYRIADEEMFPKALDPIYKKIEMSPRQFNYYAEVRTEEILQDDRNLRKRRMRQGDIFQTNSSYRAYSRMACNFVFPEEIPRPFPKEIRKKLLRREIDVHEEDEDNDEEEEDHPQEQRKQVAKEAMKIYEQDIKLTLQKLQAQGETYLTGPGLYDCSPKLHTFLKDITTNTHVKSLFYSQFRTVEGIKLVTLLLKQAGWVQIDFTADGHIVNAKEVLDPKYDYKRFLVFGDKEKTDKLLSLYNGDWKFLPKTTQDQLKEYPDNFHGKLASLLMITQSGAEGLNLRCVRYVYILEPFWNQVRIDQVIGRAIRKRSHLELPPEERNVQVVMYLATFNPRQAKANKTIQFRDDSKTTDENIKELAAKKDRIIQQFLTLLKSNAIDCVFHAPRNKPLQHKYRCYVPPLNINLEAAAFVPNLQKDGQIIPFGMQQRTRTVKGRAALLGERKLVEVEGQLYDYDAYVSAGVLMPAH